MQYSEEQLRRISAEYLRSDAHRKHARDLETLWSREAHGPRRYAKIYEDTSLTLWLLGWRPGVDTVDIHGHGPSAALIACLRGEIDEIDYGLIPMAVDDRLENHALHRSFPVNYKSSICRAGHSIYLPVGSLHEMRCDEKDGRGFALTLHAYSPRLSVMTYFTAANQISGNGTPNRLTYTARWIDTGESVAP